MGRGEWLAAEPLKYSKRGAHLAPFAIVHSGGLNSLNNEEDDGRGHY